MINNVITFNIYFKAKLVATMLMSVESKGIHISCRITPENALKMYDVCHSPSRLSCIVCCIRLI